MHWNFSFNAVQVLWILTFAAHLVLLVVLMGRERIRRFPWFTASVTIVALRLLLNRLLYGRIPQITMGEIFISLADIAALIGLAVIIEIARRAFKSAPRIWWFTGALALVIAAGAVTYYWGPWPQWKTVTETGLIARLNLMQLIAQKFALFNDVLTVGAGLLVVLIGRRFGAGWRSHVQSIAIGLMTASLAQLSLQGIWQTIARHAIPSSRVEYDRLIALQDKLLNANNAVYIAVLVWWIVTLWIEEPGATSTSHAIEGTGTPGADGNSDLPVEEGNA